MRRLCILIVFILGACSASDAPSNDTVQALRGDALSAVLNLNIFNRDASIQALPPESTILFSANVGDVNTVNYTESPSEQTFITLSDKPENPQDMPWTIEASPDIPVSYVVDVTDGTLNANLTEMNLPRFDIVPVNSTVDISFPASPFQLAIDSSDSVFNLHIPTNAELQSARIASNGGLMSLSVDAGVSFIGNIAVTSGGLTITVPQTSGVQLIVESTSNSEITLPGRSRIVAETSIYATDNFSESESQILLNGTLNSATIRIVQD